jgi:hypothetical protein
MNNMKISSDGKRIPINLGIESQFNNDQSSKINWFLKI